MFSHLKIYSVGLSKWSEYRGGHISGVQIRGSSLYAELVRFVARLKVKLAYKSIKN